MDRKNRNRFEEDLIDSFKNPDESLEELKEEYGTDAINEALKVVRERQRIFWTSPKQTKRNIRKFNWKHNNSR